MIVTFKNTDEALFYGKAIRENKKLIDELFKQKVKYFNESRTLIEEGEEKEAIYLISGQLQFTKEAIQEALKS